MPPTQTEHEELKKLLEENIALAQDTNRLLREMRRNGILLGIAKVVLWLLLLGVPLFFLSSYLGPIMNALSGQGGAEGIPSSGIFGLPSQEQLDQLLELYRGQGE